MRRKDIPIGAIKDAKLLKQWHEGNEIYMDKVFEASCNRRWGREVFEAAKRCVPSIGRR